MSQGLFFFSQQTLYTYIYASHQKIFRLFRYYPLVLSNHPGSSSLLASSLLPSFSKNFNHPCLHNRPNRHQSRLCDVCYPNYHTRRHRSTPPDIDPSLPKENGLIIEKIGVKGQLHEGTDWENILKLGIWRVPDFGTPEDDSKPLILAAHRWGYLDWSPAFRKLNSFYSLPNLKIGDTIKVIWNQRPYEYKVYSTSTGTKITEYNANLILYTCQLWNSPVRFFVYANRIN